MVAGYRDGPVTLVDSTTVAPVATLHLPAGRWMAWAKLHVTNVSNFTDVPVVCVLRGPGTAAPSHQMNVTVSGYGDLSPDKNPFALQVDALIPSGGGDVVLRCSANGSGGQVTANRIKIMAMKIGRETTVNMATGDRGSVGTGRPAIVVGSRSGPVAIHNTDDAVIAELTLGAGKWWLRSAFSLTLPEDESAWCVLNVEGIMKDDYLAQAGGQAATVGAVMDSAVNLPNGGYVQIFCHGGIANDSGWTYRNINARNMRLSALKLGSLTLLDYKKQTYGTDWPKARYITSTTNAYDLGTTWSEVGSLSVGAGDWMFMAKAETFLISDLLACELRALPDYDRTVAGNEGELAFPFQVVHHFSDAGTARLYCSATGIGEIDKVHITGIKLGSMTNVAMN